jgi:hypothetical protein
MLRRLLILATTISLVLLVAIGLLWYRSARNTDVLMLAAPGGKCLLIKSHEGRWMEISGVRDWPDRGVRMWSAASNRVPLPGPPSLRRNSWERAGPFLFWQRHTGFFAAWMAFVHGTLVVPADDGGKLPAYGDGYDRADAANAWRGVLPGQPGWLFMSGWEVRVPHTYLIALTGALPLVVVPVWLMRVIGRRRRWREGLCQGCGYDVRASSERCPECARPLPAAAAAPVTAARTAPAATAP